ncbi:MAG: hypothetical protein LUD03_05425 [Firmicutes bacterium]|nr:hypothetical protein [Bacillota bacterium]
MRFKRFIGFCTALATLMPSAVPVMADTLATLYIADYENEVLKSVKVIDDYVYTTDDAVREYAELTGDMRAFVWDDNMKPLTNAITADESGETEAPSPTAATTVEPTATPTVEPTATAAPTATATASPSATVTPTVEPTTEPTATPTVEPEIESVIWDFAEYADSAAVTDITAATTEPYTKSNGTLYIHLNSGDTITNSGLVWSNPAGTSATDTSTDIRTSGRYIELTPDSDGTISVVFSGNAYDSSSKAPRIYVAEVPDDDTAITKSYSDSYGSKTASAKDTETTLTYNLTAGVTYIIWPYYYNKSSVQFTISEISYEPLEETVTTRNIYGSDMLLQRNESFVIDGKSTAVDEVTLTLTSESDNSVIQTVTAQTSKTDEAGIDEWSAEFNAVSDYSGTYKLTIEAGSAETVEYTNIIFGDLYLFTGQSNMWKQVSYYKSIDSDAYGTAAIAANATDKIRVMHTKGSSDYGTAVLQYDAQNAQDWRDFSTYDNVSDISAPAYTAAVTMYQETGVPIGLITNAYPGSFISSWLDSALAIDNCNLGKNGTANERNWYCGRIYPLRNLKLSGIFWYQGEADAATTYHDDPYTYYSEMLPKLITTWRELFNDADLPFYYVQLSRIGDTVTDENEGDGTTVTAGKMPIKLAQTDVYLDEDLTNVGIISTLDLYGYYMAGSTANCRTDIHLGQKDIIGKRMAAYALKDIYGKDTYSHGPIYKSSAADADGNVVVTFDTNGSLKIMDSSQYADSTTAAAIESGDIDATELNEFYLAGSDGVWYAAAAIITADNQVTLSSDDVAEPVYVGYCNASDYPESPNLTDDSGMGSYVFEREIDDTQFTSATSEPTTEPQAEITATYKFDFGGETAADGYTAVTADMIYSMSDSDTYDEGTAGFLGTTATSYADDVLSDMDSRAIDGFSLVKGQYITLSSGGDTTSTDADADYIAVPAKAEYIPSTASDYEGRYPIRFSMKAENGAYYTVTATLANSSSTENACVSLFSEKRHIIAEDVTIEPGEAVTFKFNVDIEDVYYKTYSASYEDDMLNICVSGENAAIASLIVEKHAQGEGKIKGTDSDAVNDGITLWACDDSTGCDCPATVPFFALQNYSGVGQTLSKYMPENIAVSNQGERGLNSSDNMHFANCNLKEGDYLYIEYGHNESSASDYKSNLEKYYTRATESGANLIIVSAVNRLNSYSEAGGWTSDFTSYITAAEEFVKGKIDEGAENIAFVDMNTLYVDWMNAETARILEINSDLTAKESMSFYYRSVKGSSVDSTHLNDAGADQAAYFFFTAAKDIVDAADAGSTDKYVLTQAEVLRPLVEGMKTTVGDSEIANEPMTVSDEIIKAGAAPNEYWDTVPSDALDYNNSIAIDSVGTVTNEDENVTISSVGIRLMNAVSTYAKAVITVTNNGETSTYYTESNYDCTGDTAGTVKVNSGFITSDKDHTTVTDDDKVSTITVPSGAECTIQIVSCDDNWVVGDNPTVYSTEYEVTPGLGVIFDELGADDSSVGDWSRLTGASDYSETVESDDDGYYLSIYSSNTDSSGTKKNYGFYKALNENISEGKYRLSFKTRYDSGVARFALAESVDSASNPFKNKVYAFYIDSSANVYVNSTDNPIYTATDDGSDIAKITANMWINVDAVIDLDNGTISISAAGSEYQTSGISDWQSNSPSVLPLKYFGIAGSSDGTSTTVDIRDVKLVQIPQDTLGTSTITANVNDSSMGYVTIDGETATSKDVTINSSVTLKAVANDGYTFVNWTDASGAELSTSAEYTISRLHNDTTLTANFEALAEGVAVWEFAEYADSAAITATGTQTVEYKKSDETLDIHINSGDTITNGGLVWSAPGSTESDSTVVSNNRYIEYTPTTDGTISVIFSGDTYDSSTKAPRMYIVTGDSTSCMYKTYLDTYTTSGTSATATAADKATTLTYTLEAGKTYYIWPYYYKGSSVKFTISKIIFTPTAEE